MIAVNESPYQMVPRNLRIGDLRWYPLHGRRITKYIVSSRYLHIRPTDNCRNNTTLRCKTPLTQGDGQLPPSSLFALLAHYHRRRLQHAWMTGPVSLLCPLSVDHSQAVACPRPEFPSTRTTLQVPPAVLHVWYYRVLRHSSIARYDIRSGVAVDRQQPQHATLAVRCNCCCCYYYLYYRYVCLVAVRTGGATHTDGTAVETTHSCIGDGSGYGGGDVGGGGDARASERGRDGVRARRPVRLAIERLRTENRTRLSTGGTPLLPLPPQSLSSSSTPPPPSPPVTAVDIGAAEGSSGGGGRHATRRKLVACGSSSRRAPPNNGFCFLLSQATRRRNDLRERPIRRFTTTSPTHVKTIIPNRLYYTTIDVLCTRM